MMERKFSAKERALLVILGILLVAVVYLYFVHMPVTEALSTLAVRQEEAEASFLTEQARARKKKSMADFLVEAKAASDMPILADYDNVDNVVLWMDNVVGRTIDYDMKINPVSFVGNIAVRTIDMNFNCVGYLVAKNIMEDLETCPFYCKITAMTINTENENGNLLNNAISVRLRVTFYEFVDNAPPAK